MRFELFLAELKRTLGPGAVVTEPDALRTYDADASMIVARAPQVVALPAGPEQAAATVALALAAGLPVVARGAGTGIAGGAVPVQGGLLLSTARMDRVERVEARSRRAVVGAGVVNAELNALLAPSGLQFAPDPSSQKASTIGGNLATNAGGPHCLKYGVTSNHVLAVELVRPDGALLWTGDGVPEAAGYDLTGLVVGSEGTFGVVTRAIVRLTILPEAVRVVLALFPSVVAASTAVSHVIAAGSLPTSLEVMDHNAIRAVNGAYGLGLPEAVGTTLLIIEVDGVADGLEETLEEILAICRSAGAFELRPAREPADQARVWAARKAVAGAIGRLAPAYLLVDTVVPRTRLPLMMEHVERLRHEYGMEVCNVFHAGDGNLHPLVLYNPHDQEQVRRAHAIATAVLKLSIAQGGVISGEHGIGLEKQDYLPLLFNPAELALQAAIYTVFNPGDRFNPEKIFPVGVRPAELAGERRRRLLGRHRAAGLAASPVAGSRDRTLGNGSFLADLVSAVGAEHVASAGHSLVVNPGTIDELARVVALCHAAGAGVLPTGNGHATPALADHSVVVSTRRLTRLLTYEPDDLTIGVEAGMTLAELQELVAAKGQILPLEVGGAEQATLGGLVAAAADGPRRLGYGTLRDWVLGLTVVEADGTVVRLGAQVVKNVTGYDLVKLFVGSRGTLGIIAAVSLKLFPRPRASASLVLGLATAEAAFRLLDDLAGTRLQPTAAEYLSRFHVISPHPASLVLRAEGHPAAVARHMREFQQLGARRGALETRELTDDAEAELWRSIAALSGELPPGGTRIRLCAPPADLGAALAYAHECAALSGMQLSVCARALSGVAYLLVAGPADGSAALHAALAGRWRHAQILAADPAVHPTAPPWGYVPALELMRAIKDELDPAGVFSPVVSIV